MRTSELVLGEEASLRAAPRGPQSAADTGLRATAHMRTSDTKENMSTPLENTPKTRENTHKNFVTANGAPRGIVPVHSEVRTEVQVLRMESADSRQPPMVVEGEKRVEKEEEKGGGGGGGGRVNEDHDINIPGKEAKIQGAVEVLLTALEGGGEGGGAEEDALRMLNGTLAKRKTEILAGKLREFYGRVAPENVGRVGVVAQGYRDDEVCLYVCMHVYICMCPYVYIHTYIHIHTRIYMYVNVCMCVYILYHIISYHIMVIYCM